MKRCPECGREYPDDHGFCEADATPLLTSASMVPHVPETAGMPAISSRKIMLGLGSAVVLVALLAGREYGWYRLLPMPATVLQASPMVPQTPSAGMTPPQQAAAVAEGAYEPDEGAPEGKDVPAVKDVASSGSGTIAGKGTPLHAGATGYASASIPSIAPTSAIRLRDRSVWMLRASSTRRSVPDAADHHAITYAPHNAVDGSPITAWCAGRNAKTTTSVNGWKWTFQQSAPSPELA